VSPLTSAQVDTVIRQSRSVVRGNFPTMLRLTFHDCVGGCDGCVNVGDSDNNGLAALVADLETVYQDNGFAEVLSRADMWAILGIWAVQQTIDNNNVSTVPDLQVDYTYGRVDCGSAPYTSSSDNFPSAKLNYQGIMEYFATEFGFTPLEVTALMGAHTIGNAEIFNSGFHGPWVSGEATMFNNQYYANLRDPSLNWRLNQRACADLNGVDSSQCGAGQTTEWQYTSGGSGFNLPADMALFQNFTVDADGKPSCDYADCDLSATSRYQT